MKRGNPFILSLFLTICCCYSYSQIIPSSRSTDWSLAGYNGNIPVYPLVKNIIDFGGVPDGITPNDVALHNAMASLAGQNGTIYFPAGTFFFTMPITFGSGIVLKGESSNSTTLKFDFAGLNHLITIAGSTSVTTANITSSVFKEETSLTVDDASSFSVNDYIKIYQDDAALVNDSWALETVAQILHIDNISGNTIYFSNPLRRNYLLAAAARIRKFIMATGSGIECLKIKRMDATALQRTNIYFSNAANCWVKGVESDSCNFAHVQISWSRNIEITNCYFHGSFGYGSGGQGYGISCEFASGDCLVENNIFKHLRHSMLLQSGANGNVFAHNYSIEPYKSEAFPNDFAGDIVLHGNYPYLNLFEGNIVQNILIDASHGINGPFNTVFRNRAESYGIIISAGAADSSNIVGNEITGTGIGKGNYSMQGNGNLEHGNNKNNTIIPAGTTTLSDKSYFYNSIPSFWNIPFSWPTIGIPNTINTGTIPAKTRFIAGTDPAYCLSSSAVIYTFTGDGNWNVAANWNNHTIPPVILSDGSEIIIDPVVNGQCVLNVPYTINPAAKLTVKPGKKFIVQGYLTQVQ